MWVSASRTVSDDLRERSLWVLVGWGIDGFNIARSNGCRLNVSQDRGVSKLYTIVLNGFRELGGADNMMDVDATNQHLRGDYRLHVNHGTTYRTRLSGNLWAVNNMKLDPMYLSLHISKPG